LAQLMRVGLATQQNAARQDVCGTVAAWMPTICWLTRLGD